MTSTPTATNVILGATGSGKTSLIIALLGQRPPSERWAVLLNDFGPAELRHVAGIAAGAVSVREVLGCICCSGQAALRTAAVALLRPPRPQRLIIEASAAAAPASIRSILGEPMLASALDVRATLAVVSAPHLADARYSGSALYREQIAAAHLVVLTALGCGSADQGDTAREALADIAPAGTSVIEGLDALDLALLNSPGAAPHACERRHPLRR